MLYGVRSAHRGEKENTELLGQDRPPSSIWTARAVGNICATNVASTIYVYSLIFGKMVCRQKSSIKVCVIGYKNLQQRRTVKPINYHKRPNPRGADDTVLKVRDSKRETITSEPHRILK